MKKVEGNQENIEKGFPIDKCLSTTCFIEQSNFWSALYAFHARVIFLCPLKTSENQSCFTFSEGIERDRWNGLI